MTEKSGLDLSASGTGTRVSRPIEAGLNYLLGTVLAFECCTHQNLGI